MSASGQKPVALDRPPAPTSAAPGPHAQYQRPPSAISGGPDALEYSLDTLVMKLRTENADLAEANERLSTVTTQQRDDLETANTLLRRYMREASRTQPDNDEDRSSVRA